MKNKIVILLLCLIVISLGIFMVKKYNSVSQSIEVQGTANILVNTGSINTPGIVFPKSTNSSVNSF